MEKESEMTIQEGAQNGGTPGEPPQTKPSGKKTASTSNASQQNANNEGLVQAALEEEQRKAAAAQAAVEDLQRRLAEVEAALVEERRKAAQAERSLAEQATEAAGGQTTAFGLTPFVGVKGADIFAAGQQVLQQAIQQQPLAMKTYTNYLLELGRIWSGQSSVEPDAKDKRFADDMWKTNPFYHAWMQTYLTWRDSINAFLDEADMDKKDVERARFLLSLYTEAAAPTNTLLGNPAAMKKMYETGGASLVRGLTHMIEDLANNGGLPSQVNMKAFQVGQNLALSPGAVVFKNEVLELIQYQPTTQAVYCRPLLLAPPQVNKFYVLDLSPGKSLIQYLVGSGFQVFIISWRNPTPQQREWGFDTYDRAILQAIDVVRAITGSEDINILGACLAGMALATLLGHLAAQRDRRIHAATFLVTVLDSNMESTLGLFATKETIEAAKQASRSKGVVEGQELARAFAWLRPNDLIWNYWVNNYLIGNDPAAFDVLYWNNDTTRLPAKIHGEMLDLFETNAFTHPGMLKALGTPIDLSKVTMDAYIIAGITDHITPWQACYATTQLLGGTCKFILSNSGHIQAIINPPGNPKAKYFVNTRYPADAQQWLAGAKPRSGSWWEDYSGWLGERAGGQKPAPEVLGNDQYPPGIPAPGTYVFEP